MGVLGCFLMADLFNSYSNGGGGAFYTIFDFFYMRPLSCNTNPSVALIVSTKVPTSSDRNLKDRNSGYLSQNASFQNKVLASISFFLIKDYEDKKNSLFLLLKLFGYWKPCFSSSKVSGSDIWYLTHLTSRNYTKKRWQRTKNAYR